MSKKVLEKLTPEQEERVKEIVDEWMALLRSCPRINEEACGKLVKLIAETGNIKVPPFKIAPSPMAAQKMHDLEYAVEAASCGSISNYGRLARNQFLFEIGVLTQEDNAKAWEYMNLMRESCVYDMLQFEELFICIEYPTEIHLDNRDNPHNDEGPAFKWSDGNEMYFIHGVPFKKEDWEQICIHKNSDFVIGIKNMEQKQAALSIIGGETMLKEVGAKFLGKSEKGNELYIVNNYFSSGTKYCLRYFCPSTGREYVSFVTPYVEEVSDKISKNPAYVADYAMARKFQLSIEDYRSSKIVES